MDDDAHVYGGDDDAVYAISTKEARLRILSDSRDVWDGVGRLGFWRRG